MKKNKIENPIVRELAKAYWWEGFWVGTGIAVVIIGLNIIFYLTLIL